MMKWYNQKQKEQLSAYLDDELPKHEKDILEDQLISSPELREDLEASKKVKEQINSFKRLPEDDYFTGRLMETIKQQKKGETFYSFMKKPVVAFGIISLSLMGVLKFYPDLFPTFLSKQKSNIIDFYTQNLKPFVYVADLSSDDIFNFAFNNNLPLNKEDKQMLQLWRDTKGNEFVEVKYAGNTANAFNLPKFVKSLNLNAKQQEDVDSILLSYSDDIASHILVNEKNTIAVNPKIWNYHNAIRSDLLSYVAKVNKTVSQKIIPAGFDASPSAATVKLASLDAGDGDTYFVLSPDTIFTQKLHVDKNELKKEIKKFRSELQRQNNDVAKLKRLRIDVRVFPDELGKTNNLKIMVDSSVCRIQIPREIEVRNFVPNFDSLNDALDFAFNQLKNLQWDIQVDAPGRENTVSFGDKPKKKDLKKLEFNFHGGMTFSNPDSIAKFFQQYFANPSTPLDSNQLYKIPFEKLAPSVSMDMEVFKKEMEKFRSEIEKLKKEFQDQIKKNSVKKTPIEI